MTIPPNTKLSNIDLIHTFRVSYIGGMRYSKVNRLMLLITFPPNSKRKRIYADRWEDENIYRYTGMGKIGDQSFNYGQNARLRDAEAQKLQLFFFESFQQNEYIYTGIASLISIEHELQRANEYEPDPQPYYKRIVFRLYINRAAIYLNI